MYVKLPSIGKIITASYCHLSQEISSKAQKQALYRHPRRLAHCLLLRGRPGDIDLLRRTTACFLCLVLCAPVVARASDAELFFFSPDWAPGNLSTLAEAADRALSESGLNLSFQAFARYEDLVGQLSTARPALVLVPGWVAAEHGGNLQLHALLRPTRDGRDTYHKILMTTKGVSSLAGLANATVAAATHPGSIDYPASASGIRSLVGDGARILPVPKDIDALLALSFGQVDAALVTPAQFEILARVNPRGTNNLVELGRTPEVPLPRLYATRYIDDDEANRLAAGIAKLSSSIKGRQFINLLGFDEVELIEIANREDRVMADKTNRKEVER